MENKKIYNNVLKAYYDLSFLSHHGIKGQKWGVWNEDTRRRYMGGKKYLSGLAKENLLGSRSSNVNRWGEDRDHNVLYIVGLSGSGKSTVAQGLKDENTNVIHLDYYLEPGGTDKFNDGFRDKEFTEFLKNNGASNFPPSKPIKLSEMTPDEKQQHWKDLDNFENCLKKYGQQQYDSGKKVICEGVQLGDETLFPDKKFFADQPLVLLNTDSETALRRGLERDDIEMDDFETIKIRKSWQEIWQKNINDLADTAQAKAGEEYIEKLLKRL